MFDTEQKSSKFLLEIMTLVSSQILLVLIQNLFSGKGAFIYVLLSLDPWEIHVSVYLCERKNFELF